MRITQNIELDIDKVYDYRYVVDVKQNDGNSRIVHATILKNGQPLEIPSGTTAIVRVQKPDGHYCQHDAPVANVASSVSFLVTDQMTAVAGKVLVDICLISNDERLATASFTMQVGAIPGGSTIKSTNDFLELQQAAAEAKDASQKALDAAERAEQAAAIAENIRIDSTLTMPGQAADAKKVGDAFDDISELSTNIYDPNDPEVLHRQMIVPDGAIRPDDTKPEEPEWYTVTGYISVKSGKTYSFGNGERGIRYLAAFNSKKTAVKAAGSEEYDLKSWVCPDGISFMRLTFWTSTADTFRVNEGVELLDLVPFGRKVPIAAIEEPILSEVDRAEFTAVVSQIARPDGNLFCSRDPDILHRQTIAPDGIVRSDGTTTGEPEWYTVTGWIPVRSGTAYSFGNGEKGIRYLAAFNAKREAVTAAGSEEYDLKSWVCPDGISFMRLTFWTSTADTFRVNEGQTLVEHHPCGMQVRADSLLCLGAASTNLFDPDDPENLIGKYLAEDGTMADEPTYSVTGFIPVRSGTAYSFGNDQRGVRFVTAFDAFGVCVPSAGSGYYDLKSWTCPAGVVFIRLTYWNAAEYGPFRVNEGEVLLPYQPYGVRISTDRIDQKELRKFVTDVVDPGVTALPYEKATGPVNESSRLMLADTALKTFTRMIFTGTINSFTDLLIGHGLDSAGEDWLKIDNTNISHWDYWTQTMSEPEPHGLTFKDSICVMIIQDDKDMAKVIIDSNQKRFETQYGWGGDFGTVKAQTTGSNLTDCTLVYTGLKYKAPLWAYGDSYFGGLENPTRWTTHLLRSGYTNLLLDGFPGRASADAFRSFSEEIKHGTPHYIMWCMGMNDPDDFGADIGAVNHVWLESYRQVEAVCAEKNIELILATIPNAADTAPVGGLDFRQNGYKNRIVRESGHRYIDFEKAVGGQPDGTWYPGMLSADGVHPTEIGARALYEQVLTDFPEIMVLAQS